MFPSSVIIRFRRVVYPLRHLIRREVIEDEPRDI